MISDELMINVFISHTAWAFQVKHNTVSQEIFHKIHGMKEQLNVSRLFHFCLGLHPFPFICRWYHKVGMLNLVKCFLNLVLVFNK